MFKIVDAHTHIGSMPTMEGSKENLLRGMEKADVSYSLASNADASEYDSNAKKGVRALSAIEAFKETMGFAYEHPDRIGALIWIRPKLEKCTKEMYDFIKENKEAVHGLKIHPYASRLKLDEEAYIPYLKMAEELELPVLIHTAADPFSRFEYAVKIAKQFPSLNVVTSHLELYGDSYKAIDMMVGVDNMYSDTAWVNFDVASRFIDLIGVKHLIFGSDAPVDGEDTLLNPLYRCYFENRFGLYLEDWQDLMGNTARRIYKIGY